MSLLYCDDVIPKNNVILNCANSHTLTQYPIPSPVDMELYFRILSYYVLKILGLITSVFKTSKQ